jgi:hypothetical protein
VQYTCKLHLIMWFAAEKMVWHAHLEGL